MLSQYLQLTPINIFYGLQSAGQPLVFSDCLGALTNKWTALLSRQATERPAEEISETEKEGDKKEERKEEKRRHKRARQEIFPLLESGVSPGCVPFSFVQLPETFHEIFHQYLERKCERCKAEPRLPALCLLCNSFIAGHCTCKGEDDGQCFMVRVSLRQ